jgi:pyruvate kinase
MIEDAKFMLQNDIDFVIQSVYSNAKEIDQIRAIFKQEAEKLGIECTVKFMAKIENEEALKDIENIIK